MPLFPSVRRSRERTMITLEIASVERLSPSFTNITLAGNELEKFRPAGPDQAFRMFFRRPGQQQLSMPTLSNDGWMAQLILQPTAKRPWVRTYTVRAHRPEANELDVEVALHEDETGPSPATAWALNPKVGEKVGIFDEGYTYQPATGAHRQLLVGDESALPAVLAILEQAPGELQAEVYLEVPTPEDVRPRAAHPKNTTIHWLPRQDQALKPGSLALEAVKNATLSGSIDYAWVAGESALATGLRRHLVNDRGMSKSDITFTGYWRYGRSSPG